MNDIKCPYCNKTLHCGATLKSDEYLIDLYQCANPECESTEFLVGCKEFWDILGQHRRTRKALDVAVDALKKYTDASGNWWYGYEFQGKYIDYAGEYADKALNEIIALEQKDK